MRRDLSAVLALAAAWWLWSDLTAVWGPSLITVLGQAGSTSALLMGLFALACVAVPFGLVALVGVKRRDGRLSFDRDRRTGAGIALLVAALLARVVLAFVPGGQVQLWAASIGVAAALGWLALLAARHGRALATGVAAGWMITTSLAAAGGTWLPVWRTELLGILSTVVLVAVALGTCASISHRTSPLSRRQAWTLFPLALVAAITVVNPGRASTIIIDTGPFLLAIGCTAAALSVAALGRAVTPWGRVAAGSLGTLAVIASLWGTWAPGTPLPMELAWWLTPMLVAAPICLAVLLTPDLPVNASRADGPVVPVPGDVPGPDAQADARDEALFEEAERAEAQLQAQLPTQVQADLAAADVTDRAPTTPRGFADLGPLRQAEARREALETAAWTEAATPFTVLQGALVWVLGLFVYYAGYDVGYRLDWLLPLIMVGLVYWVFRTIPVPERTGGPPRGLYPVALACVVAAAAGALQHPQPSHEAPTPERDLTVAAWNVRMGYGLDGTFDPQAVADRIKAYDVVLLSEVDRGWLLNGGQDQLAILAHLSGKRLYFGPAADPVWGDAVLTDLPVTEVRGKLLAAHGAPTGAGALAVKVRVDGEPIWMVSTHLQPGDGAGDGVTQQATDLAAHVAGLASDGSAVVLGGDFNTEPGSPAFKALTAAGLTDTLADVRPARTHPAGDPSTEIDHLLVSGAFTVVSAAVGSSRASDHLPVWTDLTLRQGL